MLEFSCHTWGFNNLPLTDALGTIARLGFRYVDIGTGPHINTARASSDPTAVTNEIKRDLDDFNLKLADLYIMLPRISMEDVEKREKDVATFKALMPFITALNPPGVTVSPGVRQPDENAAHDRAVVALREMVGVAKAEDISVSIEPHLDSLTTTPDEVTRLLDAVPDLGITLDWAHLHAGGVNYSAISRLLPRARHVQVRQAGRKQLQTSFENGTLDMRQVIRALRDYDGIVCVELLQTVGWHGAVAVDSVRESARTRDALREARDEELTEL